MNKKFTFMVAALLAAGGFSANAQCVLDPSSAPLLSLDDLVSGKNYYLVLDGNTDATSWAANDIAAGMTEDSGTLTGIGVAYDASTEYAFTPTEGAIENYLWTVEKTTENGIEYFAFKNVKTGKYIALNSSGDFVTVADDAVASKNIIYFSDNGAAADFSDGIQLLAKGTSDKFLKFTSSTSAGIEDDTNESNIYLYEVEAAVLGDNTKLAELNGYLGGNGFSLAPANDKTVVDDANNIFSNKVLAVAFPQIDCTSETGEKVEAGVYLLTSYPDAVKALIANTVEWTGLTNSQKMDVFNECEFIAVSPDESYETEEVDEEGLKFVVKSGAELNKYPQDKDQKTSGSDVYVKNAIFTIIEPDNHVSPEEYQLSIPAGARIIDASKTDGSHKNAGVLYVGVTKIAGTNYVTTTSASTKFKAASSSLAEAVDFIKAEKAPSIYTIQFVSQEGKEDSEYGKFLGSANANQSDKDAYTLTVQGEDLVDLSLPQYQWVVTAINKTTQEITFANIETKENFTAQLYAEDGGSYTVVADDAIKLYVAEDDAKGIAQYDGTASLNGTSIKLTEVSDLDEYAGFVKLDVNNNVPYKLAFAKNDVISDRVYVALDPEDATNKKTILSDASALQVIFEPVMKTSKDEVDVKSVSIAYAYKNDKDVVYKNTDDLVSYYTYYMKVVDSNDNNYIKINSNKLEIESVSGTPSNKYLLKKRYDGSVALVSVASTLGETSIMLAADDDAKPTEAEFATSDNYAYAVPESGKLSLFLEAEELGLSLEAKSQHVSLESENGGFLNVNEANEGVVAIRTEAGEDLTFWLDTTNSEAYIPSFYISKGGKFMYNSTDSLWNGGSSIASATTESKAKYGIGANGTNPKAIFKAATLISSDTLKTTVDAKEVLVAEKANQNKGILGGVKDFQFNIVKASDAEDNYVIRSAGQLTQYLTNFNGVLGFIADKDNAMRVIVETQSAPTSNESVSTSEVKVVANNGSVVVKNAAGKNVVVSTILGQVVANEVLTSDNATINVPAGIVIVAVEGESFKVNVK